MVKHLSNKSRITIIFMVSCHLFYTYGLEKVMKHAKDALIDGILAPDLPCEEGEAFADLCFANQINNIFFFFFFTYEERIQKIWFLTRGFISFLSRLGTPA